MLLAAFRNTRARPHPQLAHFTASPAAQVSFCDTRVPDTAAADSPPHFVMLQLRGIRQLRSLALTRNMPDVIWWCAQ